LKREKPGLAITLDKELQVLCNGIKIEDFPSTFSLEEQGQFAIGYYHQKNKQFNKPELNEDTQEQES
jgi:CRISPR-associated protein Csd1